MLTIGQRFPEFSLTGVVTNDVNSAFQPLTEKSFPGKWLVVFFWPKDFTFVCPTEIAAFGRLDAQFKARDAQVLGASIDSEFVHLAWRSSKQELRDLPFPMLSDIKRQLWCGSASWTPRQAWRSARRSSSIRRASSASCTSPT